VKGTIQVVITTDEGQTETRELACLERTDLTPTTLQTVPQHPFRQWISSPRKVRGGIRYQ
jgi:hypothetical protein